MKKRFNTTGSERIAGMFIFAVIFIAITGILISSVEHIAVSDKGFYTMLEGYEIIGGDVIEYYNPIEGNYTGYNITNDNVTNKCYTDYDTDLLFWNASIETYDETPKKEKIRSFVVRDNEFYDIVFQSDWGTGGGKGYKRYLDFVMFYQDYGLWSTHSRVFSYEQIIYKKLVGTNVSMGDFIFSDTVYSYIITVPVNITVTDESSANLIFSNYIWNNNFTLAVGINVNAILEPEDVSVWRAIGQILTISLPNVPTFIGLIIAVTFWTMVGIVALTLISRFIPFISGG